MFTHTHSHFHSQHYAYPHHSHENGQIEAANKEYFNGMASRYSYNSTHQKASEQVLKTVLSQHELIPLNENTTRVLDYACGSGLVSKLLLPHVAQIVGLDLSEGMVSEYNTCANNQGLTHSEMHAMVADLCSPDLPKQLSQPEYQNFDVAICMFAFHHFPNPALAAKKIAERLRPDGVFAVVDFRPTPDFDRVPSSLKKMVSHNGFSDEDIKGWFSGAGLSEPTFVEVGPKDGEGKGITAFGIDKDTREKLKMTREAFLACGKRLQL